MFKIVEYKSIDSTNTKAIKLVNKGYKAGTVVIAETQYAGRGRYGRQWFSPLGGIWMTVVLPPLFIGENTRYYTIGGVISVIQSIRLHANIKPWIKYPNDVIINSKKVSGVLAESANKEGLVVLGIGLNVNIHKKDLSPEIRDIATSLLIETGKEYNIKEIVQSILKEIKEIFFTQNKDIKEVESLYNNLIF